MTVSLRKRTARLGLLFVVGMLLLQQHIALGCWGSGIYSCDVSASGDDVGFSRGGGEGVEDGGGGRDNGQRVLP